jgi:hypothetical protein
MTRCSGSLRIATGAKKDTRGGGIGCRALRHLREDSLAGMQILAGTPPRVWAFDWYLRAMGVKRGNSRPIETARLRFLADADQLRELLPPLVPYVRWEVQPLCRSPETAVKREF